ncbi:MAG: sulfite exporter TauE/SafE family protein [Pseudomonadota bacterium]
MDLHTGSMLFAAGIAGGSLASMVGGASLVTFPAFLAAGLPPITATASNISAVVPANIVAVLLDRKLLPPLGRAFFGLVAASVIGAVIGGFLLLNTPHRLFEMLIPVLLGFATVIFAFSSQIGEWLRARRAAAGNPAMSVTSMPLLLPISVYGGYFGAGVGVLLLGVLSVVAEGDYREANAIKNLVAAINTVVVVIYFAITGAVSWPETAVMAAGAVIGGLFGGRIGALVSPGTMKIIVVVIGAALTAAYAWRYWF